MLKGYGYNLCLHNIAITLQVNRIHTYYRIIKLYFTLVTTHTKSTHLISNFYLFVNAFYKRRSITLHNACIFLYTCIYITNLHEKRETNFYPYSKQGTFYNTNHWYLQMWNVRVYCAVVLSMYFWWLCNPFSRQIILPMNFRCCLIIEILNFSVSV
jgi:hypothetical protein